MNGFEQTHRSRLRPNGKGRPPIDDGDAIIDYISEAFAEPRPARTTVVVAALPMGALVEIEMTALRAEAATSW